MRLADVSALSPERLERLGPVYADLLFALGLAITREDGSTIAVPAVLTPAVLGAPEIGRRTRLATRIATATAKVARALLRSGRRGLVLDALTPLERRIVESSFARLDRIPLVRVDFFEDDTGTPRALEVNATIPALPGYSDITAQGLIRALGHERGHAQRGIARLTARNGANARALLDALRTAYQACWGNRPTPSIALCARRNDPQTTELEFLARAMTSLGCPGFLAHPDEVSIEGDELRVRGRRVDLLYRHVFASRLAPDSPLAHALSEPDRYRVFNPVGAHLEMKTTFAELSAAASDPKLAAAYGLDPDELEAARSTVAWTRRLVDGATSGPGGEPIANLVEHVAAHPERYVIKRAWEYGGKEVFIGAFAGEASTRGRIEATFGSALGWSELVGSAAKDERGGGFVVQEFIGAPRHRMLVCDEQGRVTEREGFVDFAAFASLGVEVAGWGGVCRANFDSPIVNLAGGGAMVPLLREDVAQALLG